MTTLRRRLPATCLAGLLVSNVATAGSITGVLGVFGPGLGSVTAPIILSNELNNDNAGTGFIGNAVLFDEVVFEGSGHIDIVFSVAGSGGTTEYNFIESVFNFIYPDTVTWHDFHLELGFGTGDNFVAAGVSSGLDFDAPDYDVAPSSNIFGTVHQTEDAIWFAGGTMPFGFVDAIFAHIDVPDGITDFTLRQMPSVVPEPSSAALLVFGLLALGTFGIGRGRKA